MNTQTPKYPHIHVRLVGEDGNAFSILARVRRALSHGGVSHAEVDKFVKDATRGNYDHLLCTVMDWVQTDTEDENDEFFDALDEEMERRVIGEIK